MVCVIAEVTGISSSMSKGLKATEGSLSRQVETLLKASSKKTEDERRKGATKERSEVEKIVVNALREVSLEKETAKGAWGCEWYRVLECVSAHVCL